MFELSVCIQEQVSSQKVFFIVLACPKIMLLLQMLRQ